MKNETESAESSVLTEKEIFNAQLYSRYTNPEFMKKLIQSVRAAFVGSYDWGKMEIKYLYCEKSVPRFRVNWWDWDSDKINRSEFITVTEEKEELIIGVRN